MLASRPQHLPTSKHCPPRKLRQQKGVDVNRLVSSAAIAALTLLASLPAVAANAAPVTLIVNGIDPLPGQTFTVTGDGDNCPADAAGNSGTFSVTLTYTTPAGASATVASTGSVAADGTFASSLTLPETAASNAPADVISAATCSGVATASNRVTLSVLYHTGTLKLSASTVTAGSTITTSGDSCYGGEFVIVYGTKGGDPNTYTDGASGVPASDRSFTTKLTIPPTQTAGAYDVYSLCPGTQYTAKALTVNAGAVTSTTSPPAPAPSTASSTAPSSVTTFGGGFTDVRGQGTTTGGGTTPVATAPVAVKGQAAYTG